MTTLLSDLRTSFKLRVSDDSLTDATCNTYINRAYKLMPNKVANTKLAWIFETISTETVASDDFGSYIETALTTIAVKVPNNDILHSIKSSDNRRLYLERNVQTQVLIAIATPAILADAVSWLPGTPAVPTVWSNPQWDEMLIHYAAELFFMDNKYYEEAARAKADVRTSKSDLLQFNKQQFIQSTVPQNATMKIYVL